MVKLVTELVTYRPCSVEAQSDQRHYSKVLAADLRTLGVAFNNPLNRSDNFVCLLFTFLTILNIHLKWLSVFKALNASCVTCLLIWGETNPANNETIILCLKLKFPISTAMGRCMIAEIMLCLSDCSTCPLLWLAKAVLLFFFTALFPLLPYPLVLQGLWVALLICLSPNVPLPPAVIACY